MDTSEVVGNFGRYQLTLVAITLLRAFPTSWTLTSLDFIAGDVGFKCDDFGEYNETFPIWSQHKPDIVDPCKRYVVNASGYIDWTRVTNCKRWIFDADKSRTSAIADWNLVCDRAWMKSAIQSIVFAGAFIGALCVGRLADTYGRKTMLNASILTVLVFGCLAAVTTNFILFNCFRFLMAAAVAGLQTTTCNIYTETVLPKDRTWMNIGFSLGFAIPTIILPGLAYMLDNWRFVHAAIGLSSLALVPFMIVVTESPRWLLVKKQNTKAQASIEHILKFNKRKIPNLKEIMPKLIEKTSKDSNNVKFKNIWQHKNLVKNVTILLIFWFLTTNFYFATTYMASYLKGNRYTNFALSSCAEIPAGLIGIVLIRFAPRRLVTQIVLTAAAVASITQAAIGNRSPQWVPLFLNMVCRFFLVVETAVKWIYTMEILPTPTRIFGFACCYCMGRLGGMFAPFIRDLEKSTNSSVPLVLLGLFSIASAVIISFVPETFNCYMPDTLSESNELGQEENPKSNKK